MQNATTEQLEHSLKVLELNKLQRSGIDQTDGYKQLFKSHKVVEMAKMDAEKVKIQGGKYFITRKASINKVEYLIIDMYMGEIHLISHKLYEVREDNNNILVTCKVTGEQRYLIKDGILEFTGIKHKGDSKYTYSSTSTHYKGIPSVRFNNTYRDSIKVHFLIALMKWGILDLDKCVGNEPRYTLLHKVAYKKSFDNSITNLFIKKTRDKKEPYGPINC